MKTLCLCFFTLTFLSVVSFAQPVLTDANTNLIIGDTYTFNTINTVVPEGNAGANQTWDFSTLVSASTVAASATSAAGGLIPTASLKYSYVGGTETYYKTSNTELTTLGISANAVFMNYADPEKFLSFPFQMNDTYSDTWNTTFFSGMNFYRSGTTTVTADGYGTIILPGGTYTNVLRVKTVQVYTDSIIGVAMYANYTNEMYSFYKPGNHQPLVNIFNLDYDISGNTFLVSGAYYLSTVVSAIKDINENKIADLEIFPNPASRKLNVSFKENKYENLSFALMDLTGKLVPINVIQSNNTYSIESGKTSAGIYQLNILSNNKLIASRKVQFVNE